MSESLESLFIPVVSAICILLVALGFFGIWLYRSLQHQQTLQQQQALNLDPVAQHRQRLLVKAGKACGAQACCKCKHWDLDSGQQGIMQNPAFRAAAQALSPNRMGRRADDSGPYPLPLALDTWELIGLCSVGNIGVHATDKCDEFEKAS